MALAHHCNRALTEPDGLLLGWTGKLAKPCASAWAQGFALPGRRDTGPAPRYRSTMKYSQPAVLFVCLGNICRSPLAEAAFRHHAERAGLAAQADSAGTGNWHVGHGPDPRARAEARRHGIDIDGYRARQVQAQDFSRFSHIFALDGNNLADLQRIRPAGASAALGLLMDVVPGCEGQPVADPYYGGAEDFARTWAEVAAAAQALVERLRAGR